MKITLPWPDLAGTDSATREVGFAQIYNAMIQYERENT